MTFITIFFRRWRQAILIPALAVVCMAAGSLPAFETEFKMTYPVRVELFEPEVDLMLLNALRINIDNVLDTWARVYVSDEGLESLRSNGFVVTILPDRAKEMARLLRDAPPPPQQRDATTVSTTYHTYATLTADLTAIAAAYPNITRLSSIGQSVQGREMWMMKISDNPDLEEDEPEAAYLSSMHGDEVSGKEHCYNLIDYFTTNYGTDSRVTDLIDNAVIWIMPSMNPDGTELGQRTNANGADLNRSFPDPYTDPQNTTDGRQPEVAAVMLWAEANTINLSANLHEGTLVANYPRDNNPTGSSVFTPSPDEDMFASISLSYASNNPPMYASTEFTDGITNGAAWYAIDGGMQDWEYVYYGDFEVTMEISHAKWPSGSTLPTLWDDNFESMFSYLERVHEGIRGVVTDAETGLPVAATVHVQGNAFPAYTDPDAGDYHRLLIGGTYTLQISALGYETATVPGVVVVNGAAAVRNDVALNPLTCGNDEATDLPQSIDDLETTISQLTIASGRDIAGLQIPVDISHTFIGDLTVDLQSPAGTTVRLHDRSGGGSNDIIGTFGDDLPTAAALAAFYGESSTGTWSLIVEDKAGGDTGTLNGWELDICGSLEAPATPEVGFKAVTRDGSGTLLEWLPYPELDSFKVYRATDPSSVEFFLDVTGEDGDDTDTVFLDTSPDSVVYFLVTGVGPGGEGPKGHFGE
jgi:subtilisin-like proprotein convertase family protein